MSTIEALTIYSSVVIPAGLLVALTIAVEIDIESGGKAVKWLRRKIKVFLLGWPV